MPHLILENENLILFLNLKFNFMKRRGLIFNSRPNKTAVFALDRKSTRLNSSHANESRMPSSA